MTKNLRLREVATVLGVSIGKAREIARTDPAFPVVRLSPRINVVSEADLQRYVEGKKIHAGSRHEEKSLG